MFARSPWAPCTYSRVACGPRLWRGWLSSGGGHQRPLQNIISTNSPSSKWRHTNCLRLRSRFVWNLRVRSVAPSSAWAESVLVSRYNGGCGMEVSAGLGTKLHLAVRRGNFINPSIIYSIPGSKKSISSRFYRFDGAKPASFKGMECVTIVENERDFQVCGLAVNQMVNSAIDGQPIPWLYRICMPKPHFVRAISPEALEFSQ